MIDYLRISGLGVIDEAEVALSQGFVAVTGETGAGKTMVMTALDLLFGGRANPAIIRPGAGRAEVEAGIRAADPAAIAEQYDVVLDDGLLLVGRSVGEQRSRAWLGGRAVPAALLAELGDELVVRHGQNDQRRLASARHRRHLLDRYAGPDHLAALERFGAAVDELRAATAELQALRDRDRETAQRAEVLRHGVAEIEAAGLTPGEDEELRNELRRLEHAVELRQALGEAYLALREHDTLSAESAVGMAQQVLERGAEHDTALAPIAEGLAQAQAIIGDAASAIAGHLGDLDADPRRLDALQERRALITSLQRKYGDTIEQVLAWAEDASQQLAALDSAEERLGLLQARREQCSARVVEQGLMIGATRAAAARRLGDAVTAELASLALPNAVVSLQVSVAEDEAGVLLPDGRRATLRRDGFDDVDLLFEAHPGAPPRPIEQGASGGELSRVMLALEVALAGANPVPVFVFDEVDAGIGGRAAVEVGRRLAMLAASAQVIVVTHLPQVAAFADQHIVVRKQPDGLVTASSVVCLDAADRRRELARMMAGQDDSASALAHAEELIDLAALERRRREAGTSASRGGPGR